MIIKIIFWGFSCQNLKFGIKYRNKSSASAAGGTDQSYYGTYPAKRMKRSAIQMKRPGFNGLFNEREHQAAEKASGDGRNLRLLVPGISGTEKTE